MSEVGYDRNPYLEQWRQDRLRREEGQVTSPSGSIQLDPDLIRSIAVFFAPRGERPATAYRELMAPRADGLAIDFSGDQMALVLGHLQSKVAATRLDSAREGVENSRAERRSTNDEMLAKLGEAIRKMKEAKAKKNSVLNWVTKTLAFVGALVATIAAVAATVASGGAAAPLLAMAVMGLVTTGVDLASQIATTQYGTDGFSTGSGMVSAFQEMGLSKEAATKAAGLTVVAAAVLLTVASPAMGASMLMMAPDVIAQMGAEFGKDAGMSDKEAADLQLGLTVAVMVVGMLAMLARQRVFRVPPRPSKLDTLNRTTRWIQTGASVGHGATSTYSGVNESMIAVLTKQSDDARSQAKELEAMLVKIQDALDANTAKVQELIEQINDMMVMLARWISGNAAALESQAKQI